MKAKTIFSKFNPFSKAIQKKSNIRNIDLTSEAIISSLLTGFSGCGVNMSYREAYSYYAEVQVLNTAINNILNAVIDLSFVLQLPTGEIEQESEILDLINDPVNTDRDSFLRENLLSFLLTNESWVIFKGGVNKFPLAMNFVKSYNVDVGTFDVENEPIEIRVVEAQGQFNRIFRKEKVKNKTRYFDQTNLNELIPIIGVVRTVDDYRGLIRLLAIKRDLDILNFGNIHNSSLLQKGMKPSAIFTPSDNEMMGAITEQEVLESFKAQQGAFQAGSPLFIPAALKLLTTNISNTEGDYVKIVEEAKKRIYQLYFIPPSFFSDQATQFKNLESAQTAFYDNTISGAISSFFSTLGNAFANRMTDSQRFKITYNPHVVPALKQRQALYLKDLQSLNIYSDEELRQLNGDIPEADGTVYKPTSMQPVDWDITFDTGKEGDE